MWKLLQIFLFSMLLGFLSERSSVCRIGEWGERRYIKKEKNLYFIMTVVLIFFVGLRTAYNDTVTYRYSYQLQPIGIFNLSDMDWAIGSNPGYVIITKLFRYFGVSTQNYLVFYAIITVGIYLWFIYKYSEKTLWSIFLFFTMGVYTFTMAAIKQCVAVAFCLVAVDRALENKWKSFVLWILFAVMFHPYSLMYFCIPLLMFSPWSKKTYWMLSIFAVAGMGLQGLVGSIINITTMFGEGYDADSFAGEGVNLFRLAVVWVPVIVSILARKILRESEDKKSNLMINLMMLNAEIMFVALFGTANYFARLANYFLIFQAIALPSLLKYFNINIRKFLIIGMIIGYLFYFIYSNAFLYGGFDAIFKSISFFEYIRTAF